ncbi:Vacuolar sorting protein 39 domain 2 [Carpediemonas membranifera]|uniref:Vacuolar sorting protein 39 domain 2 n=1 Tax=Carpediemonas membranifera TaxID=201153 RepID=A0A8J6APT6_9EUKA|nr:Vacuolar sorting protein 39 domain 2 [Carpediemonas membranifera]|eukprot:KAG9390436.1 Vacuolar sorting protein 39 domain 2 [Carpediemonas membranifera]
MIIDAHSTFPVENSRVCYSTTIIPTMNSTRVLTIDSEGAVQEYLLSPQSSNDDWNFNPTRKFYPRNKLGVPNVSKTPGMVHLDTIDRMAIILEGEVSIVDESLTYLNGIAIPNASILEPFEVFSGGKPRQYLAVIAGQGKKATMSIFRIHSNGDSTLKHDYKLSELPLAACSFGAQALMLGYRGRYTVFTNIIDPYNQETVCFDKRVPPAMCAVGNEILVSSEEGATFLNISGKPSRDVILSTGEKSVAITSMVYIAPYIAMSVGSKIRIFLERSGTMMQTLRGVPENTYLTALEENGTKCPAGIIGVTPASVAFYLEKPRKEQLQALIKGGSYTDALDLIPHVEMPPEDERQIRQEIGMLQGAELLRRREFQQAMDLFLECECDPQVPIAMFKGFMDQATALDILRKAGLGGVDQIEVDSKRNANVDAEEANKALECFSTYLQHYISRNQGIKAKQEDLARVDTAKFMSTAMRITGSDRPEEIISMLRSQIAMPDQRADLALVEPTFISLDLDDLVWELYFARGHHTAYLDKLLPLKGTSSAADIDRAREYLCHVGSGPTEEARAALKRDGAGDSRLASSSAYRSLLATYGERLIDRLPEDGPERVDQIQRLIMSDPNTGVHFNSYPHAPFRPEDVRSLLKVRSDPQYASRSDVWMMYLKFITSTFKDCDARYHTELACCLATQFRASGGTDSKLHKELADFLDHSTKYSGAVVAMEIGDGPEYNEIRIKLSAQRGAHDDVIDILVNGQRDMVAATDYCAATYDPADPEKRDVYVILVKKLFQMSDETHDADIRKEAVRILSLFSDGFQHPGAFSAVVSSMPRDMTVAEMRPFVLKALSQSFYESRASALKLGLEKSRQRAVKCERSDARKLKLEMTETTACSKCGRPLLSSHVMVDWASGAVSHVSCDETGALDQGPPVYSL